MQFSHTYKYCLFFVSYLISYAFAAILVKKNAIAYVKACPVHFNQAEHFIITLDTNNSLIVII